MRKRKIIIVVLLALLLGGVGVLFLSRNSEPAVEVHGNLSAQDVAQIKSAMRRHLWHEAFPNFSMQTVRALPGAVKQAWSARVRVIEVNQFGATAYVSGQYLGGTNLWVGNEFTNGSPGWVWAESEVLTLMAVDSAEVTDKIKTH